MLPLIMLLSACGFHFRGMAGSNYKFPFKTVYVECGGVVICQNLKTAISTQDLAQLESSPESAEIVIKLHDEQTSRNPQTLNSAGRIAAYILSYQAQASIWKNHRQLGGDITVFHQIIMQYNDSTILADTTEEQNFWNQLHEMATNQLIHRIIYFKPLKAKAPHVTESK